VRPMPSNCDSQVPTHFVRMMFPSRGVPVGKMSSRSVTDDLELSATSPVGRATADLSGSFPRRSPAVRTAQTRVHVGIARLANHAWDQWADSQGDRFNGATAGADADGLEKGRGAGQYLRERALGT
jgi:hypothetical protein